MSPTKLLAIVSLLLVNGCNGTGGGVPLLPVRPVSHDCSSPDASKVNGNLSKITISNAIQAKDGGSVLVFAQTEDKIEIEIRFNFTIGSQNRGTVYLSTNYTCENMTERSLSRQELVELREGIKSNIDRPTYAVDTTLLQHTFGFIGPDGQVAVP